MKQTNIKSTSWREMRSLLKCSFAFLAVISITSALESSPNASSILENMDLSVNPCDNFYEFACGNFLKDTPIDNKEKVNAYTIMNHKIINQVLTMLEETSLKNESKPLRLAKAFYKSCINKKEERLASLSKILKQLGEWPLLDDQWSEHNFYWNELVYKLNKMGYPLKEFISINNYVMMHGRYERSEKRIIRVTPSFYKKDFEALNNSMIDFDEILGASKRNATKDLKEVLKFAMKLVNITQSVETMNLKMMCIEEFTLYFRAIPYVEYFISYDESFVIDPFNPLTGNELVETDMKFIDKIDSLIYETPKRVIANYMMWRITEWLASITNKGYEELWWIDTQATTTWEHCLKTVEHKLPTVLDAFYMRKYLEQDAKTVGMNLVSDTREAFMETLKTVNWLNSETREVVLNEVKSMIIATTYLDEQLNITKLEAVYEKLDMTEDNYIQNYINLESFKRPHLSSVEVHNKPFSEVNLYFTNPWAKWIRNQNRFVISPSFQGVLFKSMPRYIQYGAMAFAIGQAISREIVHWVKLMRGIGPFARYNMDHQMANNHGIKAAYFAYNKWKKSNGRENQLPGLNYTSQQMFWISAANTLCSKDHINEVHVLELFSNEHDFAKDFNCPSNFTMNPKKKLAV